MNINLRFKLTLYSIVLVSFTAIALFGATYVITRDYLVDDIGRGLKDLAGTAALQLDGDLHEQVQTTADVTTESFIQLRAAMALVRNANDLSEHLYSLRPKGNDLEFVIMTHDQPFYGARYKYREYGNQEIVDRVLRTGKPAHTKLFRSTSAYYISGYGPIKNSAGQVVALLCVDFTAASFSAILFERLKALFWLSLLALTLTVPLSFLAVKTITDRIKGTVTAANQVVEVKDLTIRLQVKGHDEMAQLADTFNHFTQEINVLIDNVATSSLQLAEVATTMTSEGKTMAGVATEMHTKSSGVAISVKEASTQVTSIAESVRSSSASVEDVEHANRRIGKNLEDVDAAANIMASDMESLVAAVHEVSQSIQSVAQNVAETSEISHQARETTANTNQQVGALGEAAKEIGQVVKVITQIAVKTNLLALNASIEAAGAGDAGRGFAVVATEVKELANQTASATDDIQAMIQGIQSSAAAAIDAITTITAVITNIDEKTTTIAEAIERQTATVMAMEDHMAQVSSRSAEVSHNVSSAAKFSTEVTQKAQEALKGARTIADEAVGVAKSTDEARNDTQALSSYAKRTAETSEKLKSQADDLSRLAEALESRVAEFKH